MSKGEKKRRSSSDKLRIVLKGNSPWSVSKVALDVLQQQVDLFA